MDAFPDIPAFKPDFKRFTKCNGTKCKKGSKEKEETKEKKGSKEKKETKEKEVKEKEVKSLEDVITDVKYKVRIVLDERERDLFQALQKYDGIEVLKQVMPIGDIALYLLSPNSESEDLVQIYERKSVADLLASIQDGRYKEQCYRMQNSVPLSLHNMVYIIEGSMPHNEDNRKRVYSAMTSIQFFKKMSVLRTQSVQDTAELVYRTADKIQREYNDPTRAKDDMPVDYMQAKMEGGCKSVKQDNITPDNIGEILLCNVPGINSVGAKALMQRFETFPKLVTEILNNPTGPLFEDIRLKSGRRINKTCINNLIRFLGK